MKRHSKKHTKRAVRHIAKHSRKSSLRGLADIKSFVSNNLMLLGALAVGYFWFKQSKKAAPVVAAAPVTPVVNTTAKEISPQPVTPETKATIDSTVKSSFPDSPQSTLPAAAIS
jgi:hypothetical protein